MGEALVGIFGWCSPPCLLSRSMEFGLEPYFWSCASYFILFLKNINVWQYATQCNRILDLMYVKFVIIDCIVLHTTGYTYPNPLGHQVYFVFSVIVSSAHMRAHIHALIHVYVCEQSSSLSPLWIGLLQAVVCLSRVHWWLMLCDCTQLWSICALCTLNYLQYGENNAEAKGEFGWFQIDTPRALGIHVSVSG